MKMIPAGCTATCLSRPRVTITGTVWKTEKNEGGGLLEICLNEGSASRAVTV